MPAMLDDPTSPPLIRVSGPLPYPVPGTPYLPPRIIPRHVTLRDRVTIATLLPFSSPLQVPPTLLAYLSDQFNREIEKGDTYPIVDALPVEAFGPYWFQSFGAVMVLGEVGGIEELSGGGRAQGVVPGGGGGGVDWSRVCLGSFYVKPNYPGRSSHVCNGGFLVTDAARNKGVGRLMGEGYLEWAPKLGYTYSVFNLVYETNTASVRIWDALGFKRIGRVKGCGALRSHPDTLIDAIIYGRDLGPEGEDFVSEERFDKIRYYLKHGKYPAGADRAEKSRLRSAATHYKLLPAEGAGGSGGEGVNGGGGGGGEERLMLKDKEVVADAQRQYEIARAVHASGHGGINKTTATIAEKYHWVRIKETVSLVIRNCGDCKEGAKVGVGGPGGRDGGVGGVGGTGGRREDPNSRIERLVSFEEAQREPVGGPRGAGGMDGMAGAGGMGVGGPGRMSAPRNEGLPGVDVGMSRAPVAPMGPFDDMPLDPQIMQEHGFGGPGAGGLGASDVDGTTAQGFSGHVGDSMAGVGGSAPYPMQMGGDDGGAAGLGFAESVRGGRERMQGQVVMEMEMGRGSPVGGGAEMGGMEGIGEMGGGGGGQVVDMEGVEVGEVPPGGLERHLMEAGFGGNAG